MRKVFLLLFLLVSLPSCLRGSVAASGTAGVCNNSATSTFSVTRTQASADDVIVAVSFTTTTAAVTSVTDTGSNTYLLINSATQSTNVRTELWAAHNVASSTSVTVAYSGSSNALACVFSYTGVKQWGTYNTGTNASGGTINVNPNARDNGNFVVGAIGCQVSGGSNLTAGTTTPANTLRVSQDQISYGLALGIDDVGVSTSAEQALNLNVTFTSSCNNSFVYLELQGVANTAASGRLVQSAECFMGSSSSRGCAFTKAVTAGDLFTIGMCWTTTSITLSSLADTRSNTYSNVVGPTSDGGAAYRCQLQYSKNVAAGSTAVKFTLSSSSTSVWMEMAEWQLADTSSPLDVTSSGTGNSTALNSGSASSTANKELIVGFGKVANASATTAGSGFTKWLGVDSVILESETVTSTGSQSATATGTSGQWVMLMGTFKDANQGGVTMIPLVASKNGKQLQRSGK